MTLWYSVDRKMCIHVHADPEEFLNSLLQQTLKADPLIHLRYVLHINICCTVLCVFILYVAISSILWLMLIAHAFASVL